MHDIHDINSILKAVDEIILKPKKKNIKVTVVQNSILKPNKDLVISPDVDKLIQEAEDFKNKKILQPPLVNLSEKKNNRIELKNYNNNFEDVKTLIIEELYSKFSKKIKKKSLKVIFDLHLKIKDLEKKLEDTQFKKNQFIAAEETVIKNKSTLNITDKNILKKDIINSLEIQDARIGLLNSKIVKYKKKEEELRFELIDLQQDKILLLKKVEEYDNLKDYKNKINVTVENLRSIYEQVEKQKKIFIEVKNNQTKIERDSIFFKENYENLVIENNEFKKRLMIAKEQILANESNNQDLSHSINQLNEMLSKSKVTASISPLKPTSQENVLKNKNKE